MTTHHIHMTTHHIHTRPDTLEVVATPVDGEPEIVGQIVLTGEGYEVPTGLVYAAPEGAAMDLARRHFAVDGSLRAGVVLSYVR